LFIQYAFEQGIAHRHAKPEEIFPAGDHGACEDLAFPGLFCSYPLPNKLTLAALTKKIVIS
jgi:hypothetical protein